MLFAWSSRRCWTWVYGDMQKVKTIQMIIDWLGVDGYFRLKGMVCTMPDLWQKVSAKSLEWIFQTITPQWSMMSHSELWWQECLLKI